VKLAYDDSGSGSAVLFLHGFPHNRTLWAEQLKVFRDVRCIAPDLRGFGESEARSPYSMDQYADDAAELLDQLGIGSVTVVGLSMGGYVAFAFWRRYRKLVRAMGLVDTRSGADSHESRKKRDDLITLAESQGVRALADAQIAGMLGKTTREGSPELVERVHKMLASAPLEGVVGALGAMRDRVDSTPTLSGIDVPVHIVVGEEDVLTPPKESRAMQQLIPGSSLEVIAGSGHLTNLEQPAIFNRTMSDFFSRVH
jgi:3-oxoadipate enol-lactonase